MAKQSEPRLEVNLGRADKQANAINPEVGASAGAGRKPGPASLAERLERAVRTSLNLDYTRHTQLQLVGTFDAELGEVRTERERIRYLEKRLEQFGSALTEAGIEHPKARD